MHPTADRTSRTDHARHPNRVFQSERSSEGPRRTASLRPMPLWPTLAQVVDGRPTVTHRPQAADLTTSDDVRSQLLGDNHLRLDPRRLGCADPTGTSRLAHALAGLQSHPHFVQTAGWHGRATEPNTARPGPQLPRHDVLTSIGPPWVHQNVGSSQPSAGLNSVGMIVDGQLHAMPMKYSLGLQ